MSEQLLIAPSKEAQNISNKLASLADYKEATGLTEDISPRLEIVKTESSPALPQRVRASETPITLDIDVIAESSVDAVKEASFSSRPQRINASNAQEMLDRLHGSEDYKSLGSSEERPLETTGKRVDTSVEVDSPSRAPEFGGEHRAGMHVASSEETLDSPVQTGGEHLSTEMVSIHTPEKRRKFGSILRFLRIS